MERDAEERWLVVAITRPPLPQDPRFTSVLSSDGDLCAAIISTTLSELAAPTQENALAFARLTQVLDETNDLIPVRFGAAFDSKPSIARLLDAKSEVLQENLARISGKRELAIHIPLPDAPTASTPSKAPSGFAEQNPSSGLSYLRQRKAALDAAHQLERTREDALERILSELGDLCVSSSIDHERQHYADRATAALLVRAEHVEEVKQWCAAHPQGVAVFGPFAAYSFVEVEFG